jgi:hypothetical protein
MKSKMTMKKGAALCVAAVMACAALAGCSKKDDSAQSGASSAATSESSTEILDNSKLTEMPDGVTLSEDQMKTTMSAYAAYMSEALAADGYTVTVRYDDDGVHFDGSKTADDGSTVEIPDLSKFDDLKSAFAYLYNCGQADAEGNLLVSTSVSAEEAAAQEAASGDADATADSEDTDSEDTDSENTDAESTEAASEETTDEAPAEDTGDAAADASADAEVPADETAVG